MRSDIRRLVNEDLGDFWEMVATSYPGEGYSREQKERRTKWFSILIENYKEFGYYGLSRDNKLVGGMALIDFKMRLHSINISTGGIGMVTVDFLHKKEKVCKEMMSYFLDHYRSKGVNLVMLYPFNVEFYEKMGFGYGAKVNQYRVKPDSFPKGLSKSNLFYLTENDKQLLMDCYNRYQHRTNGALNKTWFGMFDMFSPEKRIVGYKKNGEIQGYIVFHFQQVKPEYEFLANMIVEELVFENKEALMEICTFLNSQSDQINRIIVNSQEENFNYLLNDPTNGGNDSFNNSYLETCVTGIGVMYRVINVKGIFKDLYSYNFGGQNCRMRITINDDFYAENNISIIVHFSEGRATLCDDDISDVEISLDISDFSSLIVGAIDFKTLYHFGLVGVSDVGYLDIINRIFMAEQKPICITHF